MKTIYLPKDAIPHYIQRALLPKNHSGKVVEVNIPYDTDPKLEGYSWLQCKCGEKRNLNLQGNTS